MYIYNNMCTALFFFQDYFIVHTLKEYGWGQWRSIVVETWLILQLMIDYMYICMLDMWNIEKMRAYISYVKTLTPTMTDKANK